MEQEAPNAVTADFLIEVARHYGDIATTDGLATLDFGCGRGGMVRTL